MKLTLALLFAFGFVAYALAAPADTMEDLPEPKEQDPMEDEAQDTMEDLPEPNEAEQDPKEEQAPEESNDVSELSNEDEEEPSDFEEDEETEVAENDENVKRHRVTRRYRRCSNQFKLKSYPCRHFKKCCVKRIQLQTRRCRMCTVIYVRHCGRSCRYKYKKSIRCKNVYNYCKRCYHLCKHGIRSRRQLCRNCGHQCRAHLRTCRQHKCYRKCKYARKSYYCKRV